MNINLKEIVSLSDSSLFRLGLVAVVALLFIAPGALILVLEREESLLALELGKLLLICAVISILYHFLGALIYLHPYQTQYDLFVKKPGISIWAVLISVGLWSTIAAGGSHFIVRIIASSLNESESIDVKILYMAVFAVQFPIFAGLFWVNLTRIERIL